MEQNSMTDSDLTDFTDEEENKSDYNNSSSNNSSNLKLDL